MRFLGFPMPVRTYLAGLTIHKVSRKADRNIFTIIRFLDMLKRDLISGSSDVKKTKIFPLNSIMYRLSPWMKGQWCLYKSLLFYLFNQERSEINIGLDISFKGKAEGHCWITIDGEVADPADQPSAAAYGKAFSQKRNVLYWLRSDDQEEAPSLCIPAQDSWNREGQRRF